MAHLGVHSSPPPDTPYPSHTTQDSQSTQMAVPYRPALKSAVGSVNAALVVSYLEMHYPSPPPEAGRRYGLPVEVSFTRMANDLAIDRRTLGLALTCVSTWWDTEIKRIGAVRAGREFLNLKHSRFAKWKLYSVVAPRTWRSLETLTLRRNWPLLTRTLDECAVTLDASRSVTRNNSVAQLHRPEVVAAAAQPSSLSTLHEIILKGVELAGDRRRTRNSRLRKAVENGLVDADALKVKRQPKTEAVDPALSDEMIARMSTRRSMRFRD